MAEVNSWRNGSRWSAAIYGGRALRAELLMAEQAWITPEWTPETIDQRIERVIASVPDLCPNCGGSGYIETIGHDGDEWFAEHELCPVCFELRTTDDENPPPRMPRR